MGSDRDGARRSPRPPALAGPLLDRPRQGDQSRVRRVPRRARAAQPGGRGLFRLGRRRRAHSSPARGPGAGRASGPAGCADAGYETHPAVEVSWFGARDYCLLGGQAAAHRGGVGEGGAGRRRAALSLGRRAADAGRARATAAPYNSTEPVGRRPAGASPLGVQDMVGNLREWTSSQYRPYPYRADDGREGAARDGYPRGARRQPRRRAGGAAGDAPAALRVSRRAPRASFRRLPLRDIRRPRREIER